MRLLMVEDSVFFGGVFRQQLARMLDATIDLAICLDEARQIIERDDTRYDAAILDFNLPDASNGEVVPFVVASKIPAIVFTGNVTDDVRAFVWKHHVVDYVIKTNASALDYLASLLKRLHKNIKVKILVVDDSSFFRKVLSDLLEVHQLQVVSAKDGKEALGIAQSDPSIKMVITDYNMPNMDGIELTENLRKEFPRDKLAIIGVSSEGDAVMAARFIKSGANDFIIKQSFLPEEFYCRVNQNLDALDHVFEIQEAAIRDYLTGLYNRRYFFEAGQRLLDTAQQKNLAVSCGMLDIDYFKKVNDSYGHDVGDIVLQKVSELMTTQLDGQGVLARIGGEEFCILLADPEQQDTKRVFLNLCETIASTPVDVGPGYDRLKVTISIGVITATSGTLDELVQQADHHLYIAKKAGRNRVVSR